MSMFLIENRCEPVPSFPLAKASTATVDVGTVVTYSCQKGYQHDDQVVTSHTTCLPSKQWAPLQFSCSGKGLVTNYGEGGPTKREGGGGRHVKFYPYETGGGGGKF